MIEQTSGTVEPDNRPKKEVSILLSPREEEDVSIEPDDETVDETGDEKDDLLDYLLDTAEAMDENDALIEPLDLKTVPSLVIPESTPSEPLIDEVEEPRVEEEIDEIEIEIDEIDEIAPLNELELDDIPDGLFSDEPSPATPGGFADPVID